MHTAFEYYLFYKPFQTLTQFSAVEGKKTLSDYLPDVKKDVYPVGRLDYDSEGLLLLTNDKQLNHRLLNPLFLHEREYWAQVEGIATEEAMQQLAKGVRINVDGKAYLTKKANAFLLPDAMDVPERNPPIRVRQNIPASWLSLCLIEGKNRQVRKMTAAVDLPTLRLIRYRIGSITIDGMQPGDLLQAGNEITTQLFTRKYK
jgi:23S rRNA pseudouridine2457 synthase